MTTRPSLKKLPREQIFFCGVMLLWMGCIFALSARPYSAEETELFLGSWNLAVRKLAHFTEYAVLTFFAWGVWRPLRRARAWALLTAVVYAIGDEFHQVFVPGRGASPFDVLLDGLGALVILGLVGRWQNQR
ncbi:VanZ family protein [Anthocerotibacter panamensis]|uniref:VanZ family protein n=1 Tax=Anthocerotibacter panamensis TaxID=2857077 RepID=UPI001C407020|nr:VanZ family protein [Anthocerotibacter panamensis]